METFIVWAITSAAFVGVIAAYVTVTDWKEHGQPGLRERIQVWMQRNGLD